MTPNKTKQTAAEMLYDYGFGFEPKIDEQIILLMEEYHASQSEAREPTDVEVVSDEDILDILVDHKDSHFDRFEALRLIRNLFQSNQRGSEWISVDKELPKHTENVLLFLKHNQSQEVCIGYYSNMHECFYTKGALHGSYTRMWMPLPTPPIQ